MLATQLGMLLGLAIAGVYAVVAPSLPALFTADAEVAAAIEGLVPLAVAMVPVNAAVYVLDGCLVGASDFKYLAGPHHPCRQSAERSRAHGWSRHRRVQCAALAKTPACLAHGADMP